MPRSHILGFLLAAGCLLAGLLGPLAAVPASTQLTLGLVLAAVILWTTEPVPLEFSSFAVLLALPAFGLLDFAGSFAPFASKTIWLTFAGMVVSLALAETGLGTWLAAITIQGFGRSPFRLLSGLHFLGLLAAIVIPSGVVRVLVLIPIGLAIIETLGAQKNRPLYTAVLLSLVCSTLYGGFGILTGAVPNLVVAGQFEQYSGEVIYWSTWIAWMFPILGCMRTLLSLAVIWFFFGRRIDNFPSPQRTTHSLRIPLESMQKRILGILLTGIAFWATDAVHHIHPVYIGLGLVLFCCIPGWGPLPFENIRKINFPFLFYLAAFFSLAAALEKNGFNAFFFALVKPIWVRSPDAWFTAYGSAALLPIPLNFLMDVAATAGLITLPMLTLGQAHGLSPLAVAMCVGMSATLIFLPYQAASFMAAYSFRKFSLGDLILCMLCISVLTLVFLFPLNLVYWHLFGFI